MRAQILVAFVCLFAVTPAVAEEQSQAPETVPLQEVLQSVARDERLKFAVTAQAPVEIVVGELEPDEITYRQLHTVLTNNALAAVAVEDVINIVPVSTIRQYPLPTLSEPDDSIADDQWVTWIYQVKNASPTMFVPIMRPMLPQQGHLVAHPESGTIVMVDRYANTLRVVELIEELDENSATTAQQ